MPEFVCRLGVANGAVVEQRRVALSEQALRRELEEESFHIFSIKRAGASLSLPLLNRRDRVSGQEFLVFNTQLRTLLRAGLPLAQSMELLMEQQPSRAFRAMLRKVYQQITSGVALSDAFQSLGDVFPRLYANSLRAGERSGELPTVLERFVAYQRLVENVRKKIIAALTYPLILVMLSVGLVTLLMTYVIPRFNEFYVGMDQELPLITRIVTGVASFTSDHLLWFVAAAVGAVVGARFWVATPTGRRVVDRVTLRIPILGHLAQLFALSQFTRSLSLLLGGGTPMVPALETAARSVKNHHVAERFLLCVPEVQEGQALSDTLQRTGLVPSLALAMVRVGESTGALPEMLTNTSEFFDEEIEFTLARIVTIIEPAILVFMGLVITGLLLAVYYPLLSLASTIN